jgi:hypothetical protein
VHDEDGLHRRCRIGVPIPDQGIDVGCAKFERPGGDPRDRLRPADSGFDAHLKVLFPEKSLIDRDRPGGGRSFYPAIQGQFHSGRAHRLSAGEHQGEQRHRHSNGAAEKYDAYAHAKDPRLAAAPWNHTVPYSDACNRLWRKI